ncbi:hypothetical protein [Cupriavidus necator]|uniref:hypothetical protein n=1 Tax=Cupriavidus necator TaxID=106590 RepID=UPI0009B8F80F|nr:hypothetical protein [Cupriavidus necator]
MPAAMLSAIALLAACGGGGDDGGNAPAPAPAPVGEPLPSLTAPQPGSTAAVGNGSEGLWTNLTTATLIDSRGKFINLGILGVLGGTFQFAGSTWTLGPDTFYEHGYLEPVTGTGTITLSNRFDGTYAPVLTGGSRTISGSYDPANALAVNQAAIAGSWKQDEFEMQIDEAGSLTGTYTSGTRVCTLQGSVTLAEPGSAENLYVVNVVAGTSTKPGTTGCGLSVGTGGYFVTQMSRQ